jgi:hypothetical protein
VHVRPLADDITGMLDSAARFSIGNRSSDDDLGVAAAALFKIHRLKNGSVAKI